MLRGTTVHSTEVDICAEGDNSRKHNGCVVVLHAAAESSIQILALICAYCNVL